MSQCKLTFYGGVGRVTGSNFLLEGENWKLLVDCGLAQGDRFCDEDNKKAFPYEPETINVLCVTHAHIDHIGRIPKLVHDGFRGKIYSTPETKSLAKLLLADALNVMKNENTKGAVLLYTEADIEHTFELWETISYHKETPIGGFCTMYLKNAGHVLGSSIIEITVNGTKIAFTGDLGNTPALLMKDTEPVTDAQYLVMDSVYGDRNHEPPKDRTEKLKNILRSTILRGGAALIPAFSLERTQVILYEINNFIENHEIPSVPVYLDSPLAIRITEIYQQFSADFNARASAEIASGDDIFTFPKLVSVVNGRDSQKISRMSGPKIIIAGSGMSTGGRIVHHELEYLSDAKSTIIIVGYQAAGSLGRELEDGARSVKIGEQTVPVRAEIQMISGYSSHKDSDHLVEFASLALPKAKKIFVVMGEPKSSLFLVQRLRDYLGASALMPEIGKPYILEF
ncbi:MBL fold metallo-hydrolase [Candidatus Parcubacteria bacterium]|nr:MBL fold metallo-hydrolase [Candidatus Parcubacteria bacterium]